MYAETEQKEIKQEVRDVCGCIVNVLLVRQDNFLEIRELYFDFGDEIIIKIPADYINQNCTKDESLWYLIFEKLGY